MEVERREVLELLKQIQAFGQVRAGLKVLYGEDADDRR
jgi:hypothetical protein